MDSMPLEGAGRVEDTINLLAHAGREVVRCAADLLDLSHDDVCRAAGAPLLAADSVKAALDKTWSHQQDRQDAASLLYDELTKLERWLEDCRQGKQARSRQSSVFGQLSTCNSA